MVAWAWLHRHGRIGMVAFGMAASMWLRRYGRNVVVHPRSADHQPLVARPDVGRVHQTERRVRLADATVGGRLRLDACARYLQDVANDDSRDAGSPNHTAWVARRTVVHVRAFPTYGDVLTLSTWCSGLGARWAERRTSITCDVLDGDLSSPRQPPGQIEAATLWVHVDLATMRPVPVPTGFADQFGTAARGRAVSARLHLPTRPSASADAVTEGWPLRSVDHDVLGHVNNSVYWAMVEEHLHRRPPSTAALTVSLEHHAAIDPGSTVALTSVTAPDGFDLWVTGIRIGAAARLAAAVRASYVPREAADEGDGGPAVST